MAYTRDGVLSGQQVKLRVVFEDDEGNLVDPDSDPTVYIYDESFSTEDIDAEVEAEVYTGSGPFIATQISTGYYEYAYTVPSGSTAGVWHDLWLSEQDGVASTEWFSFDVVTGNVIRVQRITNNTLIVIELDKSIADEDGNTLGEDTQFSFSTEYDPLYASVDLVRMEIGPWIDFIPDDTLNLLIHWASREVDVITPGNWKKLHSYGWGDSVQMPTSSKGRATNMYKHARTMFVVYSAGVRALMLPGAANAGNVSGTGGSKKLGDLAIQEGLGGIGGRGLVWDQIQELKKKRDEWWRVVNAGGNIVPGQSFDPSTGVKGFADPDRRRMGRLWEDPSDVHYAQPTVNRKFRRLGTRKWRGGFGDY